MLLRTKDATLAQHAANIAAHLRAHGFSSTKAAERQVFTLAEEVGEFVGAYRRWSGQARRTGTALEMYAELADVVITSYVAAHELSFDLDAAIAHKLNIIYTRGWREERPGPRRRVPRVGDLVKFRTGSTLWRVTDLMPGDRCRISPVLHASHRVVPRTAPLNRLIATEENNNGDLS